MMHTRRDNVFLLHTVRCLICCAVLWWPVAASAAEKTPYELEGVGIEEQLGTAISLDLPFVDQAGKSVTLRDYFDGTHPVVLALVYYECPSLCNFLLNGLTDTLKALSWSAGEQFQVVAVSIDPGETPELAAAKRQAYLDVYGRAGSEPGWHFLTGQQAQITQLAREVGFQYRYDSRQDEYAHTAVTMVLTPQGKLSRYLHGIQFAPRDYKLALLEAADGKIGTLFDRLLMYCYHYDPQGKRYALLATNIMKGAAGATVFGVALMVWALARMKRPR